MPPEQAEPRPKLAPEPEASDPTPAEADSGGRRSRGGRKGQSSLEARQAKKVKGRTIYLPDDLFERILVQAHRREMTISDYVAWVLARQVPDHRGTNSDAA